MKKDPKVTVVKPTSEFIRKIMKHTNYSYSFSHIRNVLTGKVGNNLQIEKAALELLLLESRLSNTLNSTKNIVKEKEFPEIKETSVSTILLTKKQREVIVKKTGFTDSYIYQIMIGRRKNKKIKKCPLFIFIYSSY